METAKVLVRTVARIFYDIEQIIVIDALVNHGAISSADLSLVMDEGKNHKKVHKYCATLKEGGLVSVYVRSETREGAQKPINREYFYIDYRRAVDCTKYRIHMLDEKIKAMAKPSQERKDYVCPRCTCQWTTMEVLDNVDMNRGGFLCKRCSFPLKSHGTNEEVEPEADDTTAKFNKQFRPLLDILQRIDTSAVPAVTGEDAIANAKPVPRDEHINPAQKTTVMPDEMLRPTAVKGLVAGRGKVEISISTEEETIAAERAKKAADKAKSAASNALPVWATHSAIGGEPVRMEMDKDTAVWTDPGNGLDTTEEKKTDTIELDAYFAALRQEQERNANQEETDDDESDEDEFEDVMGTPAVIASDDGASNAKRLKIDGPIAATPPSSGSEESEANEFEDAL